MAKPKAAFYWCASCGGCEEAVLDLNADLLGLVDAVDIVFWPVALDAKHRDVEAMKENELAVSFINGAVRTREQEHMAKLLRDKSALVVAFGSCAHLGGIPGLANLWTRDTILERANKSAPSVTNDEGVVPQPETQVEEGTLRLPELFNTVRSLDQVVDVDYALPGCPPPPELVKEAVTAILDGSLPEKGSVLAPERSLCDTCPRADGKPEKLSMDAVRRPHEVESETEKCLLEKGIICLGPVTRSGCGEKCINVNMPCRGCMGPLPGVLDQGARGISAIATILGLEAEEARSDQESAGLIEQIVDPAGTFYRFGMPASLLRRKRKE
jgi:F420-non-reducing hydrogenase small subunit